MEISLTIVYYALSIATIVVGGILHLVVQLRDLKGEIRSLLVQLEAHEEGCLVKHATHERELDRIEKRSESVISQVFTQIRDLQTKR